ncbi:MAG: RsmE family RNA methyltransferase [Candidatus Limnocylindria bacterium]
MVARHRFFVDRDALSGDSATLLGDQARQIAAVLRLAPGAEVVLVSDANDVLVRLDHVSSDRVTGTVLSRSPNRAEPGLALTLALPLLRGDHSEEVLEAVTQLGVSRIVPFVSERSVVRELATAKRARWERIARESAETARRGRIPEIAPLTRWAELFDLLDPPVIVAWEGERDGRLAEAIPSKATAVSLVIGPEGGLTESEIALAVEHGATAISLGPRNLRSETAAIAAVAVILSKRP